MSAANSDETLIGGLSETGIELFKDMVADFRQRKQWGLTGPPTRRTSTPFDNAYTFAEQPNVYLALTPPGGIPAMWEERGTGTGSGTQGDQSAGTTGTGTLGDVGDRPGYADCTLFQLNYATSTGRALTHPRTGSLGFTERVYNPTFTAIPGGHYFPVMRDPFGDWWIVQGGGGGSTTGFWARLTNKTFISGGYIQYTYEKVKDSPTPSAITWTDLASTGTAYEVNNVDVPVALSETPGTSTGTHTSQDEFPTIVWMWPSPNGSYALFDQPPRIEICQIISGSGGVYQAYVLRYDQVSGGLANLEKCTLIDANSLP